MQNKKSQANEREFGLKQNSMHAKKNKRSALKINALRLAMHGIVCPLVADNQQNNKRSPMPNANKVENLLFLGY